MSDRSHSPVLDETRCGPCLVCRGGCPATVFKDLAAESDSKRGRLAGPASRREVEEAPSCRAACPVGQDIPGFLGKLAQGDLDASLAIILQDNPLPAVTGQVCHHPCEEACFSAPVQKPPRIRDLKRAATAGQRPPAPAPAEAPLARVAIVGSGPAGLAAAWRLAQGGAKAVIFEAEAIAGGMTAWAIPPFRLDPAALKQDLDYILSFGVELELSHPVDKAELDNLRRDYDAVVLACGAPLSAAMELEGSEGSEVFLGLDYLKAVAMGNAPGLTAPVLVVGGGNVAVDAARTARRQLDDVAIMYRRDRAQMPAYAEEVAHAEAEGIRFWFREQPMRLERDAEGKLTYLSTARTEPGQPGQDGRVVFKPNPRAGRRVPVGSIILAVGQDSQAAQWARWLSLESFSPGENGRLAPGLYAAGDLASGPASVVAAMAGGIAVADAILKEVRK